MSEPHPPSSGRKRTTIGVLTAAPATALVLIVGVTAFVRFYRLDMTWFFLDQVRDVTVASAIAHGDSLPLLGPRIGWTGAYLGPLYYYLLALPFLVTDDPLAGAVFVAAANVFAGWLLYRFAHRFWGAPTALAAAALFGVFPLAVWSSRLVWHAGLLPLFTVLFMRALLAVAVDGRSAAVVPMLGLLAALTQLHLTAVAFFPMVVLALLFGRRRLEWRHGLIGAALGVLLYAPYLGHELVHGFENLRALSAAVADGGTPSPRRLAAVLLNALRLYRPALEGFFPGEPGGPALPVAARIFYAGEAILIGAGVLVTAYRLLRQWRSTMTPGPAGRADAFLLLWFAFPLFVLGTQGRPMWWYYFDLLYPSQFILAGIALCALVALAPRAGPVRPALAAASIGLTVALVVSQAVVVMKFQREAARQGQLAIDVTRFPINRTVSPFGRLASLPLGYRSRLISALRQLGVSADGFSRRVHGTALGLPEDNDYLVRYVEAQGRPRPTEVGAAHYLVAKDEGAASLPDGSRSVRVGPYRVVEYRPMIDYGSWSYGTVAARDRGGVPARWTRIGSTWPRLEVALPDPDALLLRGTLMVPALGTLQMIAVEVTTWEPPGAIELSLDGVRMRRIGETLRQDPLMIQRGSEWLMGAGWSAEAVFDLGESISPGEHSLDVRLEGGGRTISVDVFERGRSGHNRGSSEQRPIPAHIRLLAAGAPVGLFRPDESGWERAADGGGPATIAASAARRRAD